MPTGVPTALAGPPHRPPVAAAVVVGLVAVAGLAGCRNEPAASPQPAPTGPTATAGQTRTYRFDDGTALPTGAQPFAGTWQIRVEPGSTSTPNALCQTGTATFPAIALTTENFTDVTVSTRFKPVSGEQDKAAGIIARVGDGDNYYVLRANALENNVNIYRYVDGDRSVIAEGNATVPAGRWQELRMEITGDRIAGYLDGREVVAATDQTFSSGRVGLWTKADSVTCFDDIQVTAG